MTKEDKIKQLNLYNNEIVFLEEIKKRFKYLLNENTRKISLGGILLVMNSIFKGTIGKYNKLSLGACLERKGHKNNLKYLNNDTEFIQMNYDYICNKINKVKTKQNNLIK